MAWKQKGRPSWFRMPLTLEPVITALDDKDVGRGLKLALDYFKTGELPGEDESPMVLVMFSMVTVEMDKSIAAYSYAIESARQESNVYESVNE